MKTPNFEELPFLDIACIASYLLRVDTHIRDTGRRRGLIKNATAPFNERS